MPENKAPDLFAECLQAIQNVHRWHRKLRRRYTLDDETLETHVRLEIERFDFRSKGLCSPQARPILVVLGEVCASTVLLLMISRHRQIFGRCRPIMESKSTNP